MFIVVGAQAQNSFKAIVKSQETKEPIIGVSVVVDDTNNLSVSDNNGIILISNIPDGEHTLTFSSIGYKKKTEVFTFPIVTEMTLEVFLESESEEIDEVVIISSTRSTRTIKDIPTRVEFIAGEELEEKISPFDNYIQIIDGTAEVGINDKNYKLRLGEGIIIPAHTSHRFNANEQFKMISTIIKSGYED